MVNRGVNPDVLISSLCKEGNFDEAGNINDTVQRLGVTPASHLIRSYHSGSIYARICGQLMLKFCLIKLSYGCLLCLNLSKSGQICASMLLMVLNQIFTQNKSG